MNHICHWIGGQTSPGSSGRRGPVYNPATGEQTAEVDFASSPEVANAVAWLCLPGSEAVTGQTIAVAGGEVM